MAKLNVPFYVRFDRATGARTKVATADVAAMAIAEGASKHLVSARMRKAETNGHIKHGVGFQSPVANYEAWRGGLDNAGIGEQDTRRTFS